MFTTLFVQPLFNLLAGIYAVLPLRDFGLAVILFTILIRLALWPLVNKQLHSQRAIQQLQPELQRVRSQAKGDKQLEAKLVMELYKERGISPFASFLPLLIQLPIFFALFIVIQDALKAGQVAKLVYEPLQQLGPIHEVIKGSGVIAPTLLGLVDLAKPAPVLAALAAAAQFVQTKQLQPKHVDPNDAQARMMSGMTYVFPGLTFVIGLTLPSALALYWLVTSLVAILQQYLVLKQDVVEMEEVAEETAANTTATKKLTATTPGSQAGNRKLVFKAGSKKKGKK